MGGTKLEGAQIEKYLGEIVDQNLSGSSQCALVVKKNANRMLGYIAKSINLRKLYYIDLKCPSNIFLINIFFKKWLILIPTAFGIMFWCKTKLLKSILTFTAW